MPRREVPRAATPSKMSNGGTGGTGGTDNYKTIGPTEAQTDRQTDRQIDVID